jgi:hypothetical protein
MSDLAWFNVEQNARMVRIMRLIAKTRAMQYGQHHQLVREAQATARKYENMLRDLATECELA